MLFEDAALPSAGAVLGSRVPALLVYGDRDSTVSYDSAAQTRGGCEFHTVAGSDHGFGSREREDEDEAIAVTVSWLSRQYGS